MSVLSLWKFNTPNELKRLLVIVEHSQVFKCLVVEKICLECSCRVNHCVKSVQTRSFFWSVFSCIRTRKNSVFGHFSCSERLTRWKEQMYLWLSFSQHFRFPSVFGIYQQNTLLTSANIVLSISILTRSFSSSRFSLYISFMFLTIFHQQFLDNLTD